MRPQEKALQFLLRVIFFLAAEEQLLLRRTWSDLVFSSSLLLSILYLSLKLSICSSPILSLFLPALHSVIPTELFFCSSALSELPKSLCSFFLPHRNFFFLTYQSDTVFPLQYLYQEHEATGLLPSNLIQNTTTRKKHIKCTLFANKHVFSNCSESFLLIDLYSNPQWPSVFLQ